MALATTIRKNLATIVCGIVVAGALVALFLAFGHPFQRQADARLVALIHDGDGTTHTMPLDRDGRLEVDTSLGSNTIVVEGGGVRMEDADCPNRTCTQRPALSQPGSQIICLPHQLWIEVVPEGSDGTTMDPTLTQDAEVDLYAQ